DLHPEGAAFYRSLVTKQDGPQGPNSGVTRGSEPSGSLPFFNLPNPVACSRPSPADTPERSGGRPSGRPLAIPFLVYGSVALAADRPRGRRVAVVLLELVARPVPVPDHVLRTVLDDRVLHDPV